MASWIAVQNVVFGVVKLNGDPPARFEHTIHLGETTGHQPGIIFKRKSVFSFAAMNHCFGLRVGLKDPTRLPRYSLNQNK